LSIILSRSAAASIASLPSRPFDRPDACNISFVTIRPLFATVQKHRLRTSFAPVAASSRRRRFFKEALLVTTNVQPARKRVDAAAVQPPLASEATRLLAAVRELAPELAARAEEIEQCRRVPGDIIDRLRRLGVFRTLVPRSHGGLELTVPEVLPVLETLAAADSSVGWVAMIGTGSQLFCTRLPRATYERVYADGANAVVVGVGTPAGRAEKVNGGYRVSGRWPFASGCQNAQWIAGHCVVYKDGEPVMSPQGPQTTFVMLPVEQWRIDETWQASGLTGSGSHHVALENVEVSDAAAFDAFHGPSMVPGPLESIVAPFISSVHGAIAVGIASGAVADLVALAGAGRRQLFAAADLKDQPVVQHEFGRLGAELRAARALLEVQTATHWRRAVEGVLDGKADFAESLQGCAWIHVACNNVVSGCYTLSGSSAVLNTSPLQRRLRDIHAARQHVFAQDRFYGSAGKHALGFPAVDPISGQ
jgi:indole-3-acetate monooxygenase